jgi:hypothetical protein
VALFGSARDTLVLGAFLAFAFFATDTSPFLARLRFLFWDAQVVLFNPRTERGALDVDSSTDPRVLHKVSWMCGEGFINSSTRSCAEGSAEVTKSEAV